MNSFLQNVIVLVLYSVYLLAMLDRYICILFPVIYSMRCKYILYYIIMHFPQEKKNERKKVLPTLLKVDNLNAKCNSENRSMLLLELFKMGSICRLEGLQHHTKKFKLLGNRGTKGVKWQW